MSQSSDTLQRFGDEQAALPPRPLRALGRSLISARDSGLELNLCHLLGIASYTYAQTRQ